MILMGCLPAFRLVMAGLDPAIQTISPVAIDVRLPAEPAASGSIRWMAGSTPAMPLLDGGGARA
jgi:hypothetical protein